MSRMIRALLLCALCSSLSSACGTVQVFQNRPDWRKAQIERITILTDALIVEETGRRISKIDLLENLRVADSVTERVASWLRTMKMPVERTLPSSVGMLIRYDEPLYIVSSVEERNQKEDSLPFDVPPFFIDTTLVNDTTLMNLFSSPNPPSGALVGKNVLFLWRINAYNIPAGNVIAQSILTVLLSLFSISTNAFSATSSLVVTLTVIDADTGAILWEAGDTLNAPASADAAAQLATNILRAFFNF